MTVWLWVIVVLAIIIATSCNRQREGFVGNTATLLPISALDHILDRAVQVSQLQLAVPTTQMTNSEAQNSIDEANKIIRRLTDLHLTIISINSAVKQVSAPDQVCTMNVTVYDKDRNCLYGIIVSTVEDTINQSLRICQCRLSSKKIASQYEGVSVPGYKYEYGKP